MKIIKNKKLINIILLFLGIFMISLFIYFKFIRERLPKDIPMNLNIIGFFLILNTCCILLYVIISPYLKTETSTFSNISNLLYKPLGILHQYIITNSIILPYYEKSLIYLININIKFNSYYSKKKAWDYLHVSYIFQIIPKIILISVFLLDIFYFHYIFIFYKVILISIPIFIYKYLLYALKYAKEQYILQLESMVDHILSDYMDPDEFDSSGVLSVRAFIDEQLYAITYEHKEYHYHPFASKTYCNEYRKRNNLEETHRFTSAEFKLIDMDFYRIMKLVIPLSVHIEEYSCITNFTKIKYIKLLINSLYLIGWSYILYVSFHTLPIDAFMDIFFLDNMEPFSGLNICPVVEAVSDIQKDVRKIVRKDRIPTTDDESS